MTSEDFFLYLYSTIYGTILTMMSVKCMVLAVELAVFCSHQLVA